MLGLSLYSILSVAVHVHTMYMSAPGGHVGPVAAQHLPVDV